MADDCEFDLNYCPECGEQIGKQHGLFSTGTIYISGRAGFCSSCGKEWHVVWENAEEWDDDA